MDALSFTNDDMIRLSTRYPRFWEAAELDSIIAHSTDHDQIDMASLGTGGEVPKKRTAAWLLQLIEEIYDAAHEQERPGQVRVLSNDKRGGSSKKQASSKKVRY